MSQPPPWRCRSCDAILGTVRGGTLELATNVPMTLHHQGAVIAVLCPKCGAPRDAVRACLSPEHAAGIQLHAD